MGVSETCDVLVIGSGAGGLTTAITCAQQGLDVVVIEKAPVYGGTTAFSGGVLWIPGNHHGMAQNPDDTKDAARTYLKIEAGNHYDADAVDAFLETGPEAVEFLERETEVKFIPTLYPDYHPQYDGGVEVGRSILAAPFDTSQLGENLKRLRPPLKTITFVGMMFNSSNVDIKHFFNATKSVKSFAYVAKRLASHTVEVLRHGRGTQVTSGNALAARLAKSAFDLGVTIHTDCPAKQLLKTDGILTGALVQRDGQEVRIAARHAVVIATGGFSNDPTRTSESYSHLKEGGEHFSPVPESVTGDGISLAESVGAELTCKFEQSAAWMPVSKVPGSDGTVTAFPHLLDRYKPGIIAIGPDGKRFTNESNSYHDVGVAMVDANSGRGQTRAWLICGQQTIKRYGLGYAKPAPVPLSIYLRNGYLKSARTIQELARTIGVDTAALEQTVRDYNGPAARGEDPEYGRGSTAFNRYLGDPERKPNPNVGPIEAGPYYALEIVMGDLGTFDGLATSVEGQVLDRDGIPIPNLFAVGNDRRSVMGGAYPGAGITLGPAITFGYLTGKTIAAKAKSSDPHA
ncbi:FAD-dependent oxidoreductase [Pontivivens nitratireducens]|uniref:FAD-dependent oxidoreductase n=1 Tax=Pontivivens nitratireducens TaxID=2758038 RepID=UPI00163AC1A9|nr:FAD-dependent oxidoreductase [Pontibrevibacter nitratireducens]